MDEALFDNSSYLLVQSSSITSVRSGSLSIHSPIESRLVRIGELGSLILIVRDFVLNIVSSR